MPKLSEFREMKDAFFRGSGQSPLPREQKKEFGGLHYFDENPALRFVVPLEKYPKPEPIQMQTSTGHGASHLKYAVARFDIDGTNHALQVYKSEDHDVLFLPFSDGTTGHESYDAGRYLDLEEGRDATVTLDFNLAYNPYCAYDPIKWSCPLPPRENHLTVRIEAGEKKFHDDETYADGALPT
jgi:uncharacterized protein